MLYPFGLFVPFLKYPAPFERKGFAIGLRPFQVMCFPKIAQSLLGGLLLFLNFSSAFLAVVFFSNALVLFEICSCFSNALQPLSSGLFVFTVAEFCSIRSIALVSFERV